MCALRRQPLNGQLDYVGCQRNGYVSTLNIARGCRYCIRGESPLSQIGCDAKFEQDAASRNESFSAKGTPPFPK